MATPLLGSSAIAATVDEQEVDIWFARFPEVARVARATYTPSLARKFMISPMSRFGGRTAIDLLAEGQVEEVISVIASDYEGYS